VGLKLRFSSGSVITRQLKGKRPAVGAAGEAAAVERAARRGVIPAGCLRGIASARWKLARQKGQFEVWNEATNFGHVPSLHQRR
jgi:hypothetical protein